MNIEFERTIDDIIDFNLFHMANSPSIKRHIFLETLITALLVMPAVFFSSYLIHPVFNVPTLIASILAGAITFAFYPQTYRRSTISGLKKMFKEGNNSTILGHQAISFSPEGIFCKNQSSESKINWSSIQKVIQSEKHFFLYTSSVNAFIVPKHCLRSEKEQRDFLEYVNAHLQQK